MQKIFSRIANLKLILLYLCLQLVDIMNVTGDSASTMQNAMLRQHNIARSSHGAKPLVTNASLITLASSWAREMANSRYFRHSGRRGVGENLWMSWGSNPSAKLNYSSAIQYWMDEAKNWDFKAGRNKNPSIATGHFTQMVWKSTTSLGCAKAETSDKLSMYVCCNYYPPGNVLNKYKENVS